jgi:hypothetical protein
MRCQRIERWMPDLIFDAESVPVSVQKHLRTCSACGERLARVQAEMLATQSLLDTWTAPEISPYFDVRMHARLQEAQQQVPAGFLERMRQRLIYGNGAPHLRPAMAAALALAMIVGGGTYAGFFAMHGVHGIYGVAGQQQTASATVRDLQILDANDQTIQQLNAFEDGDGGDSTAQGR